MKFITSFRNQIWSALIWRWCMEYADNTYLEFVILILIRICITVKIVSWSASGSSFNQCWWSGSGIRFLLSLVSGMGRKSASGSGIRDEQPGSYFLQGYKAFLLDGIFKFFSADPWSGLETVRLRDLGSWIWDPWWKNVSYCIWDKYAGSATVYKINLSWSVTGGNKILFGFINFSTYVVVISQMKCVFAVETSGGWDHPFRIRNRIRIWSLIRSASINFVQKCDSDPVFDF